MTHIRQHPAEGRQDAAHKIQALSACILLSWAGHGSAQDLGIRISEAQYRSDLTIGALHYDRTSYETSYPTTSATPLSLSFQPNTHQYAIATANPFFVAASTKAYPNGDSDEMSAHAKAVAETKLTFQPSRDATTSLAFHFVGEGLFDWSEGFVSLQDLTSPSSLVSYSWTMADNAVILPVFRGNALEFQPQLLASHTYQLTMHTSTEASQDSQAVSISMSGFTSAVPDATSYALLLTGLCLVGFGARHSILKRQWR